MITKGGSSEPLFFGDWLLDIGDWLLVIGYGLEVREVFPEGGSVQGLDNLA